MAEAPTDLARNKLGVGSIVFLVLAAVAPVTVLIVVLPLAIAFGNGGGVPNGAESCSDPAAGTIGAEPGTGVHPLDSAVWSRSAGWGSFGSVMRSG